ncbi:MAG: HDOD domain-containing protein [Myxococcota bacterium]
MSALPEDRVRTLVRSSPQLATLPSAYARLSKTLDDPACNAQRVARIVRNDTALTARMLKVSNNAAFGNSRTVDTVLQAVVILGTTRIRHMALAAAVFGVFRGIPPHLLDVRMFWEHSLAVALGAEILSRRVGQPPEALFVSGLLHDIGQLVVCQNMPADALRVLTHAQQARIEVFEAERELLGFDHGEVGAELLTTWGLGAHAEAAALHHRPNDRASAWTDVIHVADVLASELHFGGTGDPVAHTLDEKAWKRLGIRVNELDAAIRELRTEFGGVVQAFMS